MKTVYLVIFPGGFIWSPDYQEALAFAQRELNDLSGINPNEIENLEFLFKPIEVPKALSGNCAITRYIEDTMIQPGILV